MDSQIRFSESVARKLGYYVYRLIDPRNGETFYVGKGTRNRVFAHVKGELGADADVLTDKLQRIRDIRRDGFETAQVIHRHGMDEETAFEVEAALIGRLPRSQQFGSRSVFHHNAILINVSRSATERDSILEAVRYAWKLDPGKAEQAKVVLAVDQGLIIGVFVAQKWLAATKQNFPGRADRPGRWGFVGYEAPEDVASLYLRRRLPDHMRKRGAANPIRYADVQVITAEQSR